jgi:UDP:flavonoid glycosyltransferase YjiC (YdhE family)
MKILICPLNWGLGHATRCVPIITNLISDGHEIVIVSDGYPLALMKQEFPTLRFIELPSYSIQYSKSKWQVGAIMNSFPAILKGIFRENRWLNQLLKTEHFDQVISDNRFGMWNKHVHSIYITHQLMVKMPKGLKFFEPLIWLMHRCFIYKYNECWIPDMEQKPGLSGDLAHKYPLPKHAKFIGILSRFDELKSKIINTDYEVVAVLSGVEPQRTIFENELIAKYRNEPHKTLIVKGQPENTEVETHIGNITIVSHITSYEMAAVLKGAKRIISRSGYSTIMDLAALNCLEKAEFFPTPGQTEQEYLCLVVS